MAQKKLSKKVRKSVNEYINILEKDKLPIKKVIVFGSQVKGNAHKWSDIDICVISSKFKNSFKALHYLLKKSYELDALIEPHPFNLQEFKDNNNSLVWEIKNTGQIVYEK